MNWCRILMPCVCGGMCILTQMILVESGIKPITTKPVAAKEEVEPEARGYVKLTTRRALAFVTSASGMETARLQNFFIRML